MIRKEIVFNKLIELYDGQGVTTVDISTALGLNRANVSNDLNKLCEEGVVIKKSGKPVLFIPNKKESGESKIKAKEELSSLDIFVAKNESLYTAIEQAKAAILYPPNGMNMLVLGETGVGKSMFVSLIHKYGIEMKRFTDKAAFITFNCADYASNPQLLLGQLFGCKKGAYTGADNDKAGLIEKANDGILFLDEVHRLPAEGQEMLFTFMDKGIYRRLGETDVQRKAKVLIVCATTEDPQISLLQTFTRRIPMTIHIPSLSERTIEERFELIATFMKEESARLGKEIKVSTNSIKSLLSYYCASNIGQLKVDIQLICAKIYAQYLSGKKNEIIINSLDLPVHVRKGLYKELEHRQLWNKLININNKYCVFSMDSDDVIFEDYKDEIDIYQLLDVRYRELKSRGIDENNLRECINGDIDNFFKKYIGKVNKRFNSEFQVSKLENIIDKEVLVIILEIIEFCEECLNRPLSPKVCYGMAIHINNSIDRIRGNKRIVNPQLNNIRVEYSDEFSIALDSLKIIDRALDISMPIDEAGFLAMFLYYDNKKVEEIKKEAKVIVIAHGDSTATSMVATANKLLGNDYAIGINAPINEKVEDILKKLKTLIIDNNINSEIILLVDMGSLTTFGDEIEKEFNIKVRVVPLVSTLHVIEATRKAIMGYSVEEILEETLKVNDLYQSEEKLVKNVEDTEEKVKKLAIVSICTTGEGGAKTVEALLNNKLTYDKSILEIININLVDIEWVDSKINKLSKEYEIISIISTFKVNTEIHQLNLEDIFIGDGIKSLQRKIDLETTYIKMGGTLETHLKHIGSKSVLNDIKCFNTNVQKKLNIKIETNRLIGMTLHIACMLDRLHEGIEPEEFIEKDKFIKDNLWLFDTVSYEVNTLVKKYYSDFEVSDNEICYIMSFFKVAIK